MTSIVQVLYLAIWDAKADWPIEEAEIGAESPLLAATSHYYLRASCQQKIGAPANLARKDSAIDDDALTLCEGSVEEHFVRQRRKLQIRLNQSLPGSSFSFGHEPSNTENSRQIDSSFANSRGSRRLQVRFSLHQRVWEVASQSCSYSRESSPCCSKNLFVRVARLVSD